MTITTETAYVLKLPPEDSEVLRILQYYDTQPNKDRDTLHQVLRLAYLRGYRHGLEDMRKVFDGRFGQEPT